MDQVKIGKFIAEMRKEQNLTQKALAEQLDISDRTVSKWECGKGIPEPSLMLPLCNILQINVNELLSGNRLSQDEYTKQAEENVISLMQEKGKLHRNKNLAAVAYAMGVLLLFLVLFLASYTNGRSYLTYFIDVPTLLILLLFLIIFLPVAGLGRDFLRAFQYIYGNKEPQCKAELWCAHESVKLAGRILLFGGVLLSFLSMVLVLAKLTVPEELGPHLAVTLISIVYGVLGNILLLPIQSYLHLALMEQQEKEREPQ